MRKRGIIVVLLVLLLYIHMASAQDADSFDPNAAAVTPPPPPDQGLQNSVLIELKDYSTNEVISNVHVEVSIDDKRTLKYVPEGGKLELFIEGAQNVIIRADKLETRGNDYYGTLDVTQTAVFLFPAGSLHGMVIDKNGNVIYGAGVKFECSANYGDTQAVITDSYGSFTKEWLPVGSCDVYAGYSGRTGRGKVVIEQGIIGDVEIVLSRDVVSKGSMMPIILGGILGLILIIVLIAIYRMKMPIAEPEVKINEEIKVEQRTKDIIVTLNGKEKDIVYFLLDNDNKANQNNIRHGTGIPKTSLCRVFESLERKNIIKVEKLGKMKKITLTDFFLGKEQNGP